MFGMRRREVITLLAGGAAASMAWPLVARAQQPTMLRVGFVGVQPRDSALYNNFRRRMAELGYQEGRNFTFDYIQTPDLEGYEKNYRELAARKVDVFLAVGNERALRAALSVADGRPIVFLAIDFDPLAKGYVLQGPRVVAIVGEFEPTGMAKHVWVDREWHLGGLPDALDEAVETDGADWPAALRNEYVGVLRVIASDFTQSPHLVTADRMYAGNAVLDAVNVQAALGQLDLLPLQIADLGGPQAVPIGDQDHCRVAMAVATILASRSINRSTSRSVR